MVPVSGPVAMIILLSGDSGSTLGSISDTRYLVARPREPRYSSAHCMFSGSSVQVPAVRFTRRTLRFHPMTHPPQAAAEAGVLALAAQARSEEHTSELQSREK